MASLRLGKGDIRRRIDFRTGEVEREVDSGCGSSEIDDAVTPKHGAASFLSLPRVVLEMT